MSPSYYGCESWAPTALDTEKLGVPIQAEAVTQDIVWFDRERLGLGRTLSWKSRCGVGEASNFDCSGAGASIRLQLSRLYAGLMPTKTRTEV
jgi:hypothetical protein